MVNDKKAEFIPFNAINEFMRDDFRLAILQEVFTNLDKSEKERAQRINRLFARGVQVPGFRNSSQAPAGVKIRQSVSLFEKSPEFAALIVNTWSDLHSPLKETTWQLLEKRNWKPLPLEVDRTLLPGFMLDWPKEDTFDSFVQAYREIAPDSTESDDNISLMVVWIGNKLPYKLYADTTA